MGEWDSWSGRAWGWNAAQWQDNGWQSNQWQDTPNSDRSGGRRPNAAAENSRVGGENYYSWGSWSDQASPWAATEASATSATPASGGSRGAWSGSSESWEKVDPPTPMRDGRACWWEAPARAERAPARPMVGSDANAGKSLLENWGWSEPQSGGASASTDSAAVAAAAGAPAAAAARASAPGQDAGPAAAAQAAPAAAQGAPTLPPPGIPPEDVYDAEFFLNRKNLTDTWRQHNAALKYFREELEDPTDPKGSQPKAFDWDGKAAVAAILPHVTGSGPSWEFDRNNMKEYDWRDLIAQLRDEDVRRVVEGPGGRSGGIVGCEISVRPNSYDHLRHKKMKEEGTDMGHMLPMWDFVVHRADGTGMRLHPRRAETWVDTIEAEGHREQVLPPRNGLGASDGSGTCRRYKSIGSPGKVRFDPDKGPPKEKGGKKGRKGN